MGFKGVLIIKTKRNLYRNIQKNGFVYAMQSNVHTMEMASEGYLL
jgi:hypothetical protein